MPISDDGSLFLYSIELSRFNLSHVNKDWRCSMCKNIIARGSYCLGWDSHKTCLNCSNTLLNNFLDSLKEMKNIVENTKTNLKEHKGKYLKNNVVCALDG